jgi:hypothetical protein
VIPNDTLTGDCNNVEQSALLRTPLDPRFSRDLLTLGLEFAEHTDSGPVDPTRGKCQ